MWEEKAPQLGAETIIYALTVFNDKLYGGTYPNGKLVEWNGTDAWVEKAPKLGAETSILSLAVFNGKLYGGTGVLGGKLVEWNGTDAWVERAPKLGGETGIYSLAVFNGKLYGGTYPNGKLVEWNGTDAWVEKAPKFGLETYIYSLAVFNGKLYGGTNPSGKLVEWNGTDAWVERAPKLGGETRIYSLSVFNEKLYGGTGLLGKLYEWGIPVLLAPTITGVSAVEKIVTVTVAGEVGITIRARLAASNGEEIDEQERVGSGDITLTGVEWGVHTVVAWATVGDYLSEPSAPVQVTMAATPSREVPTRRLSNRAQVARAFADALAKVRNGAYRVHRGPVTWVAFDFDAHPLGAAVILAETPLEDSGEATVILELFSKWRESPVERNRPLSDLTLDDLYEDVRLSVMAVRRMRRGDGEAMLAGVKTQRSTVEEVYVQGIIMGVVATIPVAF